MNILVCISQVPDTTSKITFINDNHTFNTNGIQYILNPYDEIALSWAVDVAAGSSGKVTVLHVGGSDAEPMIRKALAVGADEAVRVDAAPRDAWFVANQVAHYAKQQSFDIILTGRESIDYNGAQVAGFLGELLNIPSVSITKKIELTDNIAYVEREIEGGKEILAISLPFVAGTAEGVAQPKIPNMRGIMSARTKPLNVVSPIEVTSFSSIEHYELPPSRSQVVLVDSVDELVNLLHTKAKVL